MSQVTPPAHPEAENPSPDPPKEQPKPEEPKPQVSNQLSNALNSWGRAVAAIAVKGTASSPAIQGSNGKPDGIGGTSTAMDGA